VTDLGLSAADIAHIEAHGLDQAQVAALHERLRQPPRFVSLARAATRRDGVAALADVDALATQAAQAAAAPAKLTPMSGAASRMFGFLDRFLADQPKSGDEDKVASVLAALDRRVEGPRFAFEAALRDCLERDGHDLQACVEGGQHKLVVEHLLEVKGLGLRGKPKAVIPFHLRGGRAVCPLEEHMDEALRYAGGRLHATISPEHRPLYDAALVQIRTERPELVGVEVSFSVQHPSTDSIAIDAETGALVRDPEGAVAFFPAGHGSLLKNIDALDRPVVLRNVDNVPKPLAAQAQITRYHQAMSALLAEVKAVVAAAIEAIDAGTASATQLDAWRAALHNRSVMLQLDPARYTAADLDQQRALLRTALDRPIKLVGVVKNQGEPGGGPFVIEYQGAEILSIVEKDEIAEAQRPMMRDGEYFNPVDLMIDPTDHRGQPFDLFRFVNQDRPFIVRKPYGGREVLRLEHPGLWNGAMEGWTSIFLALPLETFAPVKEVIDLLRPPHQDD